jgi:polyisoprenyl-phosphate glycosyltransferase
MKLISIIVPVYFNEKSLEELFQNILIVEKKLEQKLIGVELIFVDDGSGDNSLSVLLKIKKDRPQTLVISLARNFGATFATKVGLKYSSGDCFLWIAADMQDDPSLIVDLVDSWISGNKYTICVREKRNDPIISKIYSNLFYFIIRNFIMKGFPKEGFDIFLIDAQYKEILLNSSKSAYMPILSFWLGIKPKIIKYERLKRKYGHTTWNFKKKLNAALDILFGFSTKPIRILAVIGIALSFASFAYAVYIALTGMFGTKVVSGFTTIVVLISFFSGLIILSISIIGEYISKIFNEINKRPDVIIEKIYKD